MGLATRGVRVVQVGAKPPPRCIRLVGNAHAAWRAYSNHHSQAPNPPMLWASGESTANGPPYVGQFPRSTKVMRHAAMRPNGRWPQGQVRGAYQAKTVQTWLLLSTPRPSQTLRCASTQARAMSFQCGACCAYPAFVTFVTAGLVSLCVHRASSALRNPHHVAPHAPSPSHTQVATSAPNTPAR